MLTKGESILGKSQRKHARDWIKEETWNKINRRKITKQKINNAYDKIRITMLAEYS
jgi:hypothetical protein